MLVAVPEPLVWPIGDRADAGREQSGNQDRFIEPGRQNAIQYGTFKMRLVNADRFEVGLVIETAGGVVVSRRIRGSDVERHVQAAGDFVEEFLFEFRIRR